MKYIYIYIYSLTLSLSLCIYVYIYIYREREMDQCAKICGFAGSNFEATVFPVGLHYWDGAVMRLGEKVQQLSQRLAFALAEAVACRPLSFLHLEHGVTGHLTGLFNKQGGDSPTQKNILFMSFMSWFFMRFQMNVAWEQTGRRPVVDLGSETQDPRRAVSLAEPAAPKQTMAILW